MHRLPNATTPNAALVPASDRNLPSRLPPSRYLDPGFGAGGVVSTSVNDEYHNAGEVVVQPDGRIRRTEAALRGWEHHNAERFSMPLRDETPAERLPTKLTA